MFAAAAKFASRPGGSVRRRLHRAGSAHARASSTPAAARSSTTRTADVAGLLRRRQRRSDRTHPGGAPPSPVDPEQAGRQAHPAPVDQRGQLGVIAAATAACRSFGRFSTGSTSTSISMQILDGTTTTGDITGLCLSADAASTPAAADLMVHLLGTPAVERVVRAGYLVPATRHGVALVRGVPATRSAPEHSTVFNNSVRAIQMHRCCRCGPSCRAGRGSRAEAARSGPGARRPRGAPGGDRRGRPPVLKSDTATPTEESGSAVGSESVGATSADSSVASSSGTPSSGTSSSGTSSSGSGHAETIAADQDRRGRRRTSTAARRTRRAAGARPR